MKIKILAKFLAAELRAIILDLLLLKEKINNSLLRGLVSIRSTKIYQIQLQETIIKIIKLTSQGQMIEPKLTREEGIITHHSTKDKLWLIKINKEKRNKQLLLVEFHHLLSIRQWDKENQSDKIMASLKNHKCNKCNTVKIILIEIKLIKKIKQDSIISLTLMF